MSTHTRQSLSNTMDKPSINITVSQLNLTPAEQSYYDTVYNYANKSSKNNHITGLIVRNLFVHTELNKSVLAEIWSLSDRQKHKYLDYQDFVIALRFIAMAQNNIPLTYHNLITQSNLPLPKFNISFHSTSTSSNHTNLSNVDQRSISTGSTISNKTSATSTLFNSSSDDTATQTQWSISDTERIHYIQLFTAADTDKDGYIGGSDAVNFFQSSGLSKSDLRKIWLLSDIDHDNQLSRDEFCIAIHLVLKVRKGIQIPVHLPYELDYRRSNNGSNSMSSTSASSFSMPPSSKHSRASSTNQHHDSYNDSTTNTNTNIINDNNPPAFNTIHSKSMNTNDVKLIPVDIDSNRLETQSARSEPINQSTDLFSDIISSHDDNMINNRLRHINDGMNTQPLTAPNTSIVSPLSFPTTRATSNTSNTNSTAVDQLRTELNHTSSQNSELSKSLISSVGELDNNNTELYILRSKLDHSKQQSIELNNKLKSTQLQLQSTTQQLTTLQQQYDTQILSNQSLTDELHVLQQQYDTKEHEYELLQQQYSTSTTEYQQIKNQQDQQLNAMTLLDNNIEQVQLQLQSCNQSIQSEQSIVQQYTLQHTSLTDDYNILQRQLQSIQEKLMDTRAESNQLHEQVEQQTNSNLIATQHNSELRSQYITEQTRLNELQAQHKQSCDTAYKLKQQNDIDTNKYNNIMKQIEQVQNDIANHQQLIDRYTNESVRIKQLIESAQSQLIQYKQRNELLANQQSDVQSQSQQHRQQQSELNSSIRQYTSNLLSSRQSTLQQPPDIDMNKSLLLPASAPSTVNTNTQHTKQLDIVNIQPNNLFHNDKSIIHDAVHTDLPNSPTHTNDTVQQDSNDHLTIHHSNSTDNTTQQITPVPSTTTYTVPITDSTIQSSNGINTHNSEINDNVFGVEHIVDEDADIYNIDDITIPDINNTNIQQSYGANNPFHDNRSHDDNIEHSHINDPFTSNNTSMATHNGGIKQHSDDPFNDTSTPSKQSTDTNNPFDQDPFNTTNTEQHTSRSKTQDSNDWANFS